MSESDVPPSVQRMIDQARWMAESERRRAEPPVPIEKEPNDQSGLAALMEALAEAGIKPGQEQEEKQHPSGRGGTTVNECMAALLQADPERLHLSARQWAELVGGKLGRNVTAAAVKQTATWTGPMRTARAMYKADRGERKRQQR